MGAYELQPSCTGLCALAEMRDINCDGFVNTVDLAMLAANWFEYLEGCDQYNLPGDLNCDYAVDMVDLAILASNWLEGSD